MNTTLFCRLIVGLLLGLFTAHSLQAQNKALDPVDRKDDWWVQRHAENVARMNQGDVELLLVGDSITHAWDNHRELRDQFFGEYKPINLGFSGDQTAHVLWRLNHLPLDKITPKVAMVMIGTNNIGHREGTTPKEAAEGIVAIVRKLKNQYPKLQIIVLNVFPRDEKPDGEYRKKVNEINAALPALLDTALPTLPRGTEGDIRVVDINAGFLDADGTLPKRIMDDFLHPGKEGYEYWGEKIAPVIKEAFQRYTVAHHAAAPEGQIAPSNSTEDLPTTLRLLRLDNTDTDDAELAKICSKNPELVELTLGNTKITDAGLAHLTKLTKLRVIRLSRTVITDTGMSVLAKCEMLENVDVSQTKIGDFGVWELRALPRLKNLNLYLTFVTDAGLDSFRRGDHRSATRIERLNLDKCPITDEGIPKLASLTNLAWLHLGGTAITDTGLSELAKFESLKEAIVIIAQI